jgi:hypothetical protein
MRFLVAVLLFSACAPTAPPPPKCDANNPCTAPGNECVRGICKTHVDATALTFTGSPANGLTTVMVTTNPTCDFDAESFSLSVPLSLPGIPTENGQTFSFNMTQKHATIVDASPAILFFDDDDFHVTPEFVFGQVTMIGSDPNAFPGTVTVTGSLRCADPWPTN